MNIAIVGYGKMGEQIEIVANENQDKIVAYIDDANDWKKYADKIKTADVAIEFSTPQSVIENIYHCFELDIPIIVGTTGWYNEIETIKNKCLSGNHSLLYASNFSLGVNLFFALNRYLANLMKNQDTYDVSIEEIHHINKKDTPSGTAITLANDIIKTIDNKKSWINEMNDNSSELSIKSERQSNNVGTHIVSYTSEWDTIEIKHTALNLKSFAIGAVKSAHWLMGKKGFFNINDMLKLK